MWWRGESPRCYDCSLLTFPQSLRERTVEVCRLSVITNHMWSKKASTHGEVFPSGKEARRSRRKRPGASLEIVLSHSVSAILFDWGRNTCPSRRRGIK
jgi:hypothetical protein